MKKKGGKGDGRGSEEEAEGFLAWVYEGFASISARVWVRDAVVRRGEQQKEEKKRQESWAKQRAEMAGGWGRAGGRGQSRQEGYIRNLILISPQFNYSADKSCTCTA